MKRILQSIYLMLLSVWAAPALHAFSLETYAEASALATGRWVKISVSQSGMHCIAASTLSKWGFSDPARVRVHGYGGAMLPDILSPADYIDDLPRVASQVTGRGLVFYAEGPQQINMDQFGSASHAVNPYSNYGYYYLTEGDAPTPLPDKEGTALTSTDECAVSAQWVSYYDPQVTSIGKTGRMMVGDEFVTTRTRTYTMALPDRTPSTSARINVSFVANASSKRSEIKVSANGTRLPFTSADVIAPTSGESDVYGNMATVSKSTDAQGSPLNVGIEFQNTGVVKGAWLNYVEVVYQRTLAGSQHFLVSTPSVASAGAAGGARHVWDVTDPRHQYALNVGPTGAWRNDRAGVRRYAVWGEGDEMPEPELVGDVVNQNLHGLASRPDMVIITPEAYLKASNTIANLHRTHPDHPLTVEVITLGSVLNEFGSGSFDPGAIRRFLKMLYDRGNAEGSTPLRYALLMGKGSFDNRALTSVGQSLKAPMPLWISENSLNDSQSYSTDDYFGLLDDLDGTRPAREKLNIAVGRIPVTSASDANAVAEKLRTYMFSMPTGPWRTRMTVLADDENQGQHMTQCETMFTNMLKGEAGKRLMADKIYCDAYEFQSSTYPQARTDLFRNFSDGTAIFAFIGHGSPTALGSKHIIQPNDFRTRFFLRKLPFFYAATCSFLKWDTDITSQAESLMMQADGGMIGCISALRPVYITNNGDLTASFGKVLADFDDEGRVPTMGEIYRLTKNGVDNDANKLRYVFMGDPALHLAVPGNDVTLDAINGTEVSEREPYTVMARQELTLTGRITDTRGNLLSDFNGFVTATFYDAEYSTTSHGYGAGKEVTFEQMGEMLFMASGTAVNGEYSINVRMPRNIADNYRPATMSLYAVATGADDRREAAGANRNLYAFGYDDSAPDDNEAPVIHSMILNDEEFESGGDINPAPLLIARLSDNTGLNVSTAGIGQKMMLSIDGSDHFYDVAGYFTPDPVAFAGRMSGTLSYPVSEMPDGEHRLRLRVWDIDGNFTDREIDCNVRGDLAPEIYEVYTDALPARSEARFYVRHNRPDQVVKVTVSVYDLMGRRVWSGDTEARSDMEVSRPLVWDLCNEGGTRVPRGIYVYRAELTLGESLPGSASKKLAVANE